MARYKMTVVFDVHDDEDDRLEELQRLAEAIRKGQPPLSMRELNRRAFKPTDKEKRLRELEHNPLVDGSYFLRDVMDSLHGLGAFPYDENHMPMYRTTCDIISCEKLEEE